MEKAASFHERVGRAVCDALRAHPAVLAGWEGGSVAFEAVDQYSDLDLNLLVSDAASIADLYAIAEVALERVSPITLAHDEPPGRYYKLRDGGEYFLVDLCFLPAEAVDQHLEVERHGRIRRLFDKGAWLEDRDSDDRSWEARRTVRLRELEVWYSVSQAFVWKAVHRGQPSEALAAYWGYTLKPLVELLGMKYRPARWDFGMRYLDRDLPGEVYDRLRDAMYIRDPEALAERLVESVQWGEALIAELVSRSADVR